MEALRLANSLSLDVKLHWKESTFAIELIPINCHTHSVSLDNFFLVLRRYLDKLSVLPSCPVSSALQAVDWNGLL
jgi:hypothetical protein